MYKTATLVGIRNIGQMCFEYNLHSALGLNVQGRPINANGANNTGDEMAWYQSAAAGLCYTSDRPVSDQLKQ